MQACSTALRSGTAMTITRCFPGVFPWLLDLIVQRRRQFEREEREGVGDKVCGFFGELLRAGRRRGCLNWTKESSGRCLKPEVFSTQTPQALC